MAAEIVFTFLGGFIARGTKFRKEIPIAIVLTACSIPHCYLLRTMSGKSR